MIFGGKILGLPLGTSVKEVYNVVSVPGTAEINPSDDPLMTFARAVHDGETRLPGAVHDAYPEANAIIPAGVIEAGDPSAPDATGNLKVVAGTTRMVLVSGLPVKLEGPGFE